jgi:hypothetical protein
MNSRQCSLFGRVARFNLIRPPSDGLRSWIPVMTPNPYIGFRSSPVGIRMPLSIHVSMQTYP